MEKKNKPNIKVMKAKITKKVTVKSNPKTRSADTVNPNPTKPGNPVK
jgi:hypothetical protein